MEKSQRKKNDNVLSSLFSNTALRALKNKLTKPAQGCSQGEREREREPCPIKTINNLLDSSYRADPRTVSLRSLRSKPLPNQQSSTVISNQEENRETEYRNVAKGGDDAVFLMPTARAPRPAQQNPPPLNSSCSTSIIDLCTNAAINLSCILDEQTSAKFFRVMISYFLMSEERDEQGSYEDQEMEQLYLEIEAWLDSLSGEGQYGINGVADDQWDRFSEMDNMSSVSGFPFNQVERNNSFFGGSMVNQPGNWNRNHFPLSAPSESVYNLNQVDRCNSFFGGSVVNQPRQWNPQIRSRLPYAASEANYSSNLGMNRTFMQGGGGFNDSTLPLFMQQSRVPLFDNTSFHPSMSYGYPYRPVPPSIVGSQVSGYQQRERGPGTLPQARQLSSIHDQERSMSVNPQDNARNMSAIPEHSRPMSSIPENSRPMSAIPEYFRPMSAMPEPRRMRIVPGSQQSMLGFNSFNNQNELMDPPVNNLLSTRRYRGEEQENTEEQNDQMHHRGLDATGGWNRPSRAVLAPLQPSVLLSRLDKNSSIIDASIKGRCFASTSNENRRRAVADNGMRETYDAPDSSAQVPLEIHTRVRPPPSAATSKREHSNNVQQKRQALTPVATPVTTARNKGLNETRFTRSGRAVKAPQPFWSNTEQNETRFTRSGRTIRAPQPWSSFVADSSNQARGKKRKIKKN